MNSFDEPPAPSPRKRLPCLVCGKTLDGVWDYKCDQPLTEEAKRNIQPSDALMFFSTGHYGSTVWDPVDGSQLEIHICDEHIRDAIAQGRTNEIPPDLNRRVRNLRARCEAGIAYLRDALAHQVDHDPEKIITIEGRITEFEAELKRVDQTLGMGP